MDTDPLPFSITAGGAVLLVELAAVNLHVVFLLVALARSPEPAEGWYAPVRPVMYRCGNIRTSSTGTIIQSLKLNPRCRSAYFVMRLYITVASGIGSGRK